MHLLPGWEGAWVKQSWAFAAAMATVAKRARNIMLNGKTSTVEKLDGAVPFCTHMMSIDVNTCFLRGTKRNIVMFCCFKYIWYYKNYQPLTVMGVVIVVNVSISLNMFIVFRRIKYLALWWHNKSFAAEKQFIWLFDGVFHQILFNQVTF